MITILTLVFMFMILGGIIKLFFRATFGIFKILGSIIAFVAFPVLILAGGVIVIPIILILIALGFMAMAASLS